MSATDTPHTYGRRYAWALVGGFTAASVVLNAAHAVLGMQSRSGLEQALAALVAVVAPVSLLLATHLVVGLIRDWSHRRRWVTRLRTLCAITTVGIGGVAFATSFVALMDMAALMGVAARLTWALPAVVDAMIIIATLAVVVAEAEVALDQAEAAEAERAAQAAEADRVAEQQAAAQAVQYDAEAQVLAPAEAVAHPAIERSDTELSTGVELLNLSSGLDDVADEHAPAQPVEQGAQNEVAQPEQSSEATEHPAQSNDAQASELGLNGIEQEDQEWLSTLLSGLDEGAQCADEGVEQVDWIETEQPRLSAQLSGVEQPAERATEQPEQSAQIEIEHAIEHATEQPEHATEQPAQTDARSLAERAHPELNPKVSVEVLAGLIEASRAGASQRRLGDMAGVSPNTAARYVQAAERLGATTVAAGTPEGEER